MACQSRFATKSRKGLTKGGPSIGPSGNRRTFIPPLAQRRGGVGGREDASQTDLLVQAGKWGANGARGARSQLRAWMAARMRIPRDVSEPVSRIFAPMSDHAPRAGTSTAGCGPLRLPTYILRWWTAHCPE